MVAPAVAGIMPGEEDTFILQEINRLDRNILIHCSAMEENAKIDAEYRASVIQQQKEELALEEDNLDPDVEVKDEKDFLEV